MRRLTIAAAVLAVGLTACGTSPSPSSETATPPVTLSGTVNDHGTKDLTSSGATVTLRIEQHDFYFSPTFVKVTPGAKVTVDLANMGGAPHTFTITGIVDREVAPGATVRVSFTLPSSGVIAFFCRFHQGSGMQGAFYFTRGESAAGGTSSDPGY